MSRGGRSRTLAITGGSGFVGQHLLTMAIAQGYQVRALTRGRKAPGEEIVWVEGSLGDKASLERLADGADAIIHVAGLISGDKAAFETVNVTGTAFLVDAARAAKVGRIVHISSLAAREPDISLYGWSKARSERVIAASGLQWTIIRPPAVYGPGDRETLELFKMARRGLVPLPPKGRFSVVHVEDLCRLILAVIDNTDSFSEIYEPDDGREGGWSHRHFARTLSRIFDKRAATFSVPKPVMRGMARLDRLFRGSKAKLTRDRVDYFCHPDWVVNLERRPPGLLWQPQVRTPTGLKQTAEWYSAEGWLP